ncbi:DUF2968 domain-containing protein [Caballeronia sp. LjRoot34]|uniref:DUF2968 domain-containing protein n=1 Tax=Caballeronia sp. LjRoot34 TaxID=3342325 RepID=UPI003ECD647D
MCSPGDAQSAAATPEASVVKSPLNETTSSAAVGAATTGGNVATLTALSRQGRVTELRSSSVANYQAQSLFYGDGLTYYIALLQHDAYWLVVATAEAERANAVYADFLRRTLRLSLADQTRTELEANTAMIQRIMAETKARQAQAQADFDVAQAQSEQSAAFQSHMMQEVTTLQQEEEFSALAQLTDARRHLAAMRLVNASFLGIKADPKGKRSPHIKAGLAQMKALHPKKNASIR